MPHFSLKTKFNFRKHTALYAALALIAVCVNWIPLTKTAQAAIPKYINFQGKLTNKVAGTNVADGTYAFEFKIYDAVTSGSLLWTETFDQASGDCAKLTVTSGVFNAKLGSCSALTIDMTGGSLYLSVNFAPTGTSYDGEMSPRKQLVSSPFAFVANSLNGDGNIDLADFDVDSDGKTIIAPDTTGDALTVSNSATADIQGLVISSSNSTQTAGTIQVTSNTVTDTAVLGMALTGTVQDAAGALTVYGNKTTLTVDTDAGSSHTAYGQHITIANNDASSTAYGLYVDAGAGAGTEYAAAFMNGSVGIGTGTPTASLQVATAVSNLSILASDKIRSTTSIQAGTNFVFSFDETTGLSATNGARTAILSGNATDGASAVGVTLKNTNTLSNGTSKVLNVLNNSTEILTVLGSGNVGIGDASPTALLTVGTGDLFQVNSSGAIAAVVGITNTGAQSTTVQSATALTVARTGSNYALQVDTNTASSATGVKITAAAAAGGVAIAAISSGTDENITFDAKGAGTVSIGATSTGNILFGGGSGSTGCTLTNSTGAFACTAAITGSNLSGTNTGDQTITLTGDVTGSGTGSFATTIGADKILESHLKAVDSASDEECLTYETTTGDFEWQTCGSTITADSLDFIDFEDTLDLDAALTLNQGTNGWVQNYTGTTTTGLSYIANSLTSGTAVSVSSSSLTSGALVTLSQTGNGAASNTQQVLNVSGSGNSNGTLTYGAAISNTHSGGGVNIALDLVASGGGANYALYAASGNNYFGGNVGVGINAPTSQLHVQQAADSTNTSTPVAFDVNSAGATGELTATAAQTFARIAPVVNQTGAGGYTALLVNATETATGSAGKYLLDLQTDGASKFSVQSDGTVINASTIFGGGDIYASSDGVVGFAIRSRISSPADSNILLTNAAANAFNLLQFGGTSSSFPALKRSTTTLQAKLADDSGYASFDAGNYLLSGTDINTAGTLTNVAYENQVNAFTAAQNITSTSATALTVAASGSNYGLQVDESAGSAATGLKITPAAAASGIALAAISSSTNENLTLDAKGNGTVSINGSATGDILFGGGSGSTGCTVTNSTGAFACTAGGSFTTLGLAGAITGATGITSSGTINFSTLSASSAVYTDGSKNLTSTAPTSGTIGYWSRSGTTLQPATSNDVVAISSNAVAAGGVLDITSSGTVTSGNNAIRITANSVTTGVGISLSTTGVTTGTALNITGPSTTGVTTGLSSGFIKVASDVGSAGTGGTLAYFAPDYSAGTAATSYGLTVNGTDATTVSNNNYNVYSNLAMSNNATSKWGAAFFGNVTSSSTLADSTFGGYFGTNASGAISSGSRGTYGVYSSPSSSGANSGGTTNLYGVFSAPNSYNSTTGSTVNVYGSYTSNQALLTTGGTINSYGNYIANGSMNTTGTSTQYGLYVENQTGADNNYTAVFAGGNVGIGTTTPTAFLHIGSNGAASNPGLKLSGSWFTGGDSTTTKPQALIEASGATSSGWSTSGTGLGINAPSGFAGKMIDVKLNGTTAFSLNEAGGISTIGQGITNFSATSGYWYQPAATVSVGNNGDSGASSLLLRAGVSGSSGGNITFNVNNSNVGIWNGTGLGIGTGTPVDPLSISTAVNASATRASLNLSNTALSGGSSNGTYIGANPGAFTGNFFDFQVANTSVAKLTSGGALTVTSCTGCGSGATAFDAIGDPSGNGAINMGTTVQTLDWGATTTTDNLSITSSATGITSGSAFKVTSATTGAVTNGIAQFIASGAYTGAGGVLSVTANSTATGTIARVSGTALTSGTGINVTGSGATMTTGGELIDLALGANTVGAGLTITGTGAYTGTGAADGYINVVGNSLTTGYGSQYSFTGMTSGTGVRITGGGANMLAAGELVDLQMGAATVGAGLAITTSGVYTGAGAIQITANSATTGIAQAISTTGLTTGSTLRLTGSGATMQTGGDLVDLVLGANTVGAGLTITGTGAYTGTGAADGYINVVGNSLTTGYASQYSFTGMTSGTGIRITGGGANMLAAGELIDLQMGAATVGSGINITTTGVYTGAGIVQLTANSATTGTISSMSATGLTTGKALLITSGSALTTGNAISLTGSSYLHTGTESGSVISLTYTDASSNASGTATTSGILLQPTINTTASAGAKVINGVSISPTQTACGTTAGTCTFNGYDVTTPALTQTTTNTYNMRGLNLGTAGALVQNTAAGAINWVGANIQMPNITQTTGTVTSTGLAITGGTVTSGTAYALTTSSTAGNVGIGKTTPNEKLNLGDGSNLLLDSGYMYSPQGGFGRSENRIKYTEELDNAAWTKTGVTITANSTTGPDGYTTADTIGAGGTSTDRVSQPDWLSTSSTSTTWTGSVWLKKSSGSGTVNLRLDSGNQTGTANTVTVTTSWQRFTVTQAFNGSSTGTVTFIINNGTTAYYGWGAQLEKQSTAGIYVRNGSRGNTGSSMGLVVNGHEANGGSESATSNPFTLNFDGWSTDSNYTTGMYIRSLSDVGYAPMHIKTFNEAYDTYGSISTSNVSGLDFSAGGVTTGSRFRFSDVSNNYVTLTNATSTNMVVVDQPDAQNSIAMYINTEESTMSQTVFAIETDGNASGDTVKFGVNAAGGTGIGFNPTAMKQPSGLELQYSSTNKWGFINAADGAYLNGNAYYDGAWRYIQASYGAAMVNASRGHIAFYTTATTGSADGTISDWTEKMRVAGAGQVSIGTTGTSGLLTLAQGDVNDEVIYINTEEATPTQQVFAIESDTTTADTVKMYITAEGEIKAKLNTQVDPMCETSGVIGSCTSDGRLKTNVIDLEDGTLDKIMQIKPRYFDWLNGAGEHQPGFIAQEVQAVLPATFRGYTGDGYLKFSKDVIIPYLTKALQELNQVSIKTNADGTINRDSFVFEMPENQANTAQITSTGTQAVATTGFVINQKGSGNIIQLQQGGVDKLLMANDGSLHINTTIVSGIVLEVKNNGTSLLTIDYIGTTRLGGTLVVKKDVAVLGRILGSTAVVAKNTSNETIHQGDLLMLTGATAEPMLGDQPTLTIAKAIAGTNTVIVGVADRNLSDFNISPDSPVTDDPTTIKPGEYVSIVITGTYKKVFVNGSITLGDKLTASSTAGKAEKLAAEAQGQVFGISLDSTPDSTGSIRVMLLSTFQQVTQIVQQVPVAQSPTPPPSEDQTPPPPSSDQGGEGTNKSETQTPTPEETPPAEPAPEPITES